MRQLLIGWAQTDITPDRPVYLPGQFYERISHYVHDRIMTTALALDDGGDQAVLVSLDMVGTPVSLLKRIREQLEGEPGLDTNKISMHATHTHTSLCCDGETLIAKYEAVFGKELIARIPEPDNVMRTWEVMDFLTEKLTTLVLRAWRSRRLGGISFALDYASVAFNRRPVFSNGEAIMYGVCSREDFVRLEGSSDHMADMLYTWDADGMLTGVAVDIPCPSQVMELHSFLSADYWDPARSAIRERLGNVFVLPMCGAAGDQNPLDLIRISRKNAAELARWSAQTGEVFRNFDMSLESHDIGERIADAVARGYRKARNRISFDTILRHMVVDMDLPIRTVTDEEYGKAAGRIENEKALFSAAHPMETADMVPLFSDVGTVLRWQRQQQDIRYNFEMHVIRVGKSVIATNPFELFAEYGMRIKARSMAEQTFLVQLSNEKGGYLPTRAALEGGSYSSAAASTLCGPDGGDILVEQTLGKISELWR